MTIELVDASLLGISQLSQQPIFLTLDHVLLPNDLSLRLIVIVIYVTVTERLCTLPTLQSSADRVTVGYSDNFAFH